MLLDFRVKNYKSFIDEVSFTMLAAPKQKGLDYSLFKTTHKGKQIKALPTSVIYGPNASGKTNIISAMDTLRSIILRGNIRNADEGNVANPAASNLELIPNSFLEKAKPVEFFIDFMEKETRVQYKLSIDLGLFSDAEYDRKVIYEELIVDGTQLFERTHNALKMQMEKAETDFSSEDGNIGRNAIGVLVEKSLNQEELLLTNGFRLIVAPELVKFINDWFASKFMVICRADSLHLIKKFTEPQKKTIYVDRTVNEAARVFGINSNALGYIPGENDAEPKLVSVCADVSGKKLAVDAESFESYGTIRFVNTFPLVMRAIATGATLVIDEFDASLHPMALMSIINIFHNDDVNVHHAQLIFNTHNPIFLNSNLMRRDEIKFVERNDDTHKSILYALSDFGTAGENGVRLHEDYMKSYFISRYGAIKDIDFTPIFEGIVGKEKRQDNGETEDKPKILF